MLDYSGKRVLVTGAAGGVGRALVQVFAALGGTVIAYDIDGEGLAQLGAHETSVVDLTDKRALRDAVDETLKIGVPHAVISNLGWTRVETLADIDDDNFAHELHLNLTSSVLLSRALLPAMRERAVQGAFVFISSVNAHAHFGNPAYSAAKGGLEAWMRAIATEQGRYGIRANAIAPASIRTQAWDHRFERDPDIGTAVSRLYPLGRMVEPIEVANAAAFLASPFASGITGTTLAVDCGLLASNLRFLDAIASEREH